MSSPKLRFKGFEENWTKKNLGDTCEIKTGNKDTQNRIENGLYPFFVRSNTVEKINSYSFDGEAILTSGDGVGVGKNFHYINGKFDFHQRVYSLRNFKNQYSGKFIYFLFSEKFYDRVIRLSAKNSVDSVRMNMISDMTMFFPDLSEQEKIATFFTTIDQKLNLLKEKKEKLELYKKGVMQQIFSQKLKFKDEQGNEFPVWEEKKLGEVLTIGSGRDYKHLKKGNVPVYGTGGLMLYVDDFLYDGESVGIGRKGTINKPVFLENKFWTVDTLFYTHSFKNCIPKFIYFTFLTINWLQYNEAGGVPSLSKSTIDQIKIKIPSLPEQQKIAQFLSTLDAKINLVETQIQKTELWKKGLLQQMFV